MERDNLIQTIQNEGDPDRARLLLDLHNSLEEGERARMQQAAARWDFWKNPVLIAVATGAASLIFGIVSSAHQHAKNVELERERLGHEVTLERERLQGDLALEREKLALELLRGAVTSERSKTVENIHFLYEAQLLGDIGKDVVRAANLYSPERAVAALSDLAEPAARVPPPAKPQPTRTPTSDPMPSDKTVPVTGQPVAVAPPVAERPRAPTATGRVLQTAAFPSLADAAGFLTLHFSEDEQAYVLLKNDGAYPHKVVLPLEPESRVTEIIDGLPEEVRSLGPFILRLEEHCQRLGDHAAPETDVMVRECTLIES